MRFLLSLCLVVSLFSTSSKAQYYFIFKARGIGETFRDCEGKAQRSLSGHAFVSLVRRDESLQQTIVDSTWGFVPNQRGLMALVSTPGHSETTCIGDLGSADFMVEVDRVTYEYAKNLKSKWVAKQYGIIHNVNCVDFVKAMLELVTPEVRLPDASKRNYLSPASEAAAALLNQWYKVPKPFLSNLKQLNIARDRAARQSLANTEITTPQQLPQATRQTELQEYLDLYSNVKSAKNETKPINNSEKQSKPVNSSEAKPQSNLSTNLLGGTSADALGRILLKAIQTNDLQTWTRCIHPDISEDDRAKVIRMLPRIRNRLTESGLTDWQAVRFSRVKYSSGMLGRLENAKYVYNLSIEFTYKNLEYTGIIHSYPAATQSDRSIFYMWGEVSYDYEDTGLYRSNSGFFR